MSRIVLNVRCLLNKQWEIHRQPLRGVVLISPNSVYLILSSKRS